MEQGGVPKAGQPSRMCEHVLEEAHGNDLRVIRSFWKRVNELASREVVEDSSQLECLTCGAQAFVDEDGTDGKRCAKCPPGKSVLALHRGLLQIYCGACDDIVYEPEFDAARCHALITASNKNRKFADALEPGVGLRGLCNLGNTCYMNSVLQVLSQQTSIRNFFLTENHNLTCKVACTIRKGPDALKLQKRLLNEVLRSEELGRKAMKVSSVQTPPPAAVEIPNEEEANPKKRKRRRKKKPTGLIENWTLKRDEELLPRYACHWLQPWCSSSFIENRIRKEMSMQTESQLSEATEQQDEEVNTATGCIGCEVDLMIKDIYCGSNAKAPVALNHLLYSTWQQSPSLSGYMQQDAHEFFSFIVNSVHAASLEHKNIKGKDCHCPCIMHDSFGGMLCSQITCSTCGSTSENYEPFFDISLDCPAAENHAPTQQHHDWAETVASSSSSSSSTSNSASGAKAGAASPQVRSSSSTTIITRQKSDSSLLEGNDASQGNGSNKRSRGANKRTGHHVVVQDKASTASSSITNNNHHVRKGMGSPRRGVLTRGLSFNAPPISLQSMLQKFVEPETLNAAIQCEKCQIKRENCSKRLRFERLPPILCLHIKRFKQGTTPANAQKSDQTVTFPLQGLDMSSFISNGDEKTIYDLCAVVQHTGNIDSGHYFCFVLHQQCWFRCDDVFIRRVYEHEVSTAQGYMLFYTKR